MPEQRIADGTVRFQVLMARLVGLRVRGDAGPGERLIAAYLQRLTQQEVFNRYEAERYLLLAGDLPGYNVRLALRSAGAARGEVIGEVIVQRYSALADVLRQEFGLRQEDSAEDILERLAGREILALTLGLDVAGDLEPRAALLRLQDQWVQLISQLAAAGPAVLVVEDLHWCDASTLTTASKDSSGNGSFVASAVCHSTCSLPAGI